MVKIAVAVGRSAEAKQWKNRSFFWGDFVDNMRKPRVTNERYAEYTAMSKKEQGKVKDVGGYVCGYLNGGLRGKVNVKYRSALTLDLDFAPYNLWDTFTVLWDCAAVLHSTHKHSKETPRYRLIVPLDREVTPDEYVAIARKFAASINIEYFDSTTFDTNRLMFWPSVSKDGEYLFYEQDGPPLCADSMLRKYRDWKDISEWAFSKRVLDRVQSECSKNQEDPLTKNNIVGYFCNTYDIHTAIAEFLSDVYEHVGGGRYTFLQGSTASGLVTYDDVFAFSHHGTDPASGQLCNAFDLVRIHKFGSTDEEGNTSKSYKAMSDFCRELEPVKNEIVRNITRSFDEYKMDTANLDGGIHENKALKKTKKLVTGDKNMQDMAEDWRKELKLDKFNKLENSAHNITLILKNDELLANRLNYNLFSSKKYVIDALPWHTDNMIYPRPMKDVDFSGFRNYIERKYGITGPQKIDDAIDLELNRNSFHPVRKYLESLDWDGIPRIDTLLIDCFNAVDNVYTREVSRKWLVAAVSRIMNPGCKFDNVISLIGEEGTRKSSFFRKLAVKDSWFSESISAGNGKESYEQLQGKMIIEVAEGVGFSNREIETIKHFITKQTDSFRPAYGRESIDFQRQCVFALTTNDRTFLRSGEGNRRFWPISVQLEPQKAGKIDPMSSIFDNMIPQIWAEAVVRWRFGESLILSNSAELIAYAERKKHSAVDPRAGIIEKYLEIDLPENWDDIVPEIRADYLSNPREYGRDNSKALQKRKYVCIPEIRHECFRERDKNLDRRRSMEITAIMRTLPGWVLASGNRNFPYYGKQRYYERIDV
jgi:predicted P-loop ATPase